MRCIDADEVKNSIYECINKSRYGWPHDEIDGLATALECINRAPTIDVVLVDAAPIKKGKWMHDSLWVRCPFCKKVSVTEYNFCPNCGADMRD